MTIAEARIFLSCTEEQDPQDAFEEQLFQFKQFFTTKPIIRATFSARLIKLNNLSEAAEVMGIALPEMRKDNELKYVKSDSILKSFQNYQQLRSILFQKINASFSIIELKFHVENLLRIFSEYCASWPATKKDTLSVILSKEPDPMELLMEIKSLLNSGIQNFEDLAKDLRGNSDLIYNESMRLFLLHQKELEWMRS
jgi:hypothetical protein